MLAYSTYNLSYQPYIESLEGCFKMELKNNKESKQGFLKGYIFFWTGQLASILGSNIVQFGILYWITIESYKLYPSIATIILGISAFLGFGSYIVMSPIAGVFVDRWSRKKIIAISDSLQAGITFVLIYLFMTGLSNIWLVIGVLTFRGLVGAFHGPATQAIIPLMVPKKHLTRMNSLSYFANSLIAIVGPPIGALLFFFFAGDLASILWIDVVTFLIAIVPVLFIHIPSVTIKKEQKQSSFKTEFAEGLVFIRQKKGLLTLLSAFTLSNLFLTPVMTLLPLFTLETIALGNEVTAVTYLAILTGLQNLGMLLGSILMSIWGGFKRNVVGVTLGLSIMGIGLLIVALTPAGVFWVPIIGIFIIGFMLPVANVHSQTIWQKVVPPEKLGRVFSVRVAIAQFTAPVGMLLGGTVAAIIGISSVFLICGIIQIFALVAAWTLTSLPHVEEGLFGSQIQPEGIVDERGISNEIKPNVEPIGDSSIE